jgi:hypothetical protein
LDLAERQAKSLFSRHGSAKKQQIVEVVYGNVILEDLMHHRMALMHWWWVEMVQNQGGFAP